jgi:transcriptional repressor NrdR
MRCPRCSNGELAVVDTRVDGESIRRRRECQQCRHRFNTFERVEVSLLVIKKDGRRESFLRAKLKDGIERAFIKRPISAAEIEGIIESVEKRLYELGRREVPSQEIGTLVLQEVRKVDPIAYVRFASVYREFTSVADFLSELNEISKDE